MRITSRRSSSDTGKRPPRSIIVTLTALLYVPSGCTSVDHVGGSNALVEAALDDGALAERLSRIDVLHAEPRTVERVQGSLEFAMRSLSLRNGHAAAWRAVRACAWLSLHHPDRDGRLEFGERGISIGRAALRLEGLERAGRVHYYTALSMGGYCQEKGTCAPDFIRAMCDHAKAAREAEAAFDHCGPGRFLGQLILGTLDYPVYSIGELADSIEELRRVHASCPGFPENSLSLADALIENGDDDEAAALLEKVVASAPPADHTAEHARWVERARELLDEL